MRLVGLLVLGMAMDVILAMYLTERDGLTVAEVQVGGSCLTCSSNRRQTPSRVFWSSQPWERSSRACENKQWRTVRQ